MADIFRNKLNDMTRISDVGKHHKILEDLRLEFNHDIIISKSDFPNQFYSCLIHAFYLENTDLYKKIFNFRLGCIYVTPFFINFLLDSNLLNLIGESSANINDLIIYFSQGYVQHIGRVISNSKILSKWGRGNLYTHSVWEVPICYGDEVRYYSGPNPKESFDLFVKYTKIWGMDIKKF